MSTNYCKSEYIIQRNGVHASYYYDSALKLIIIIIIIILLQFFCFDHSKATRLQSGNLVMKERVAQRNRMTQCQAVVTDNTLMLN